MKKWIYISILLFTVSSLFSQEYLPIDMHARNAPQDISKDIAKLTEYLAHDYESDLEKVRSFYIWMAYNIAYDNSAYSKNRKRINRSNADVLDRRQAVCFGYSTLFNEMCHRSGIASFMVNGYIKNQITGVADISTANHSWNVVRIDSVWQLLDITWGSGNELKQLEDYFLTAPDKLIYSHLPANPMWQLLDCPIQPGIFKKPKEYVSAVLKSNTPCFNFQDSIDAFLQLSPIEQKVKTTTTAYHFNPISENKEELGHIYMDYVSTLSDRVAQLELTDSFDLIKAIHLQIIELGKEAEQLIELYDHQKENLAYSHFNYAIALSKGLPDSPKPNLILEEMLLHFEKAKTTLEALPENFMIKNALGQISEYIEWVDNY